MFLAVAAVDDSPLPRSCLADPGLSLANKLACSTLISAEHAPGQHKRFDEVALDCDYGKQQLIVVAQTL